MQILTHIQNNIRIAEVTADDVLIHTIEDGTDVLNNVYYQEYDHMILKAEHIMPEFFDLKTRIAGEILQKFSNRRMRLAIVGDFSVYNSQSLRDFIFESNKGKLINFVNSIEEAIERLSRI